MLNFYVCCRRRFLYVHLHQQSSHAEDIKNKKKGIKIYRATWQGLQRSKWQIRSSFSALLCFLYYSCCSISFRKNSSKTFLYILSSPKITKKCLSIIHAFSGWTSGEKQLPIVMLQLQHVFVV